MSWTKTRSTLANTLRADPEADVTALRQRLREEIRVEKLEEHIARVVAEAPPLTAEQRDRLAALLRPAA